MKRIILPIVLTVSMLIPVFVIGQVKQNAEALQSNSKKIGKDHEKTNGLFRFDIIGGVNLSQVDGDLTVGFKRVGAGVGLGLGLPITDNWLVGLELLYSMKGAKQSIPQGTYYSYDLKLDYVEIPILARYTYDIFTVGVGFSYGRLINFKETVHSGNELSGSLEEAKSIWGEDNIKTGFDRIQGRQYVIPLDVYDPNTGVWTENYKWAPGMFTTSKMRYNDWSILVDLKFRVWKNLSLGVRYAYSMAPIRKETYTIGAPLGAVIVDYNNEQLYDQAIYNDSGQIVRINEQFFDSRNQYNNTLTFRAVWTFNWNGKTVMDKKKEL